MPVSTRARHHASHRRSRAGHRSPRGGRRHYATARGLADTSALPLGRAGAHRLLWRAGFGPRPGDLRRFAALTRGQAVRALTRPHGAARLIGPPPRIADGSPLAPYDRYGHDHLWWLDRMVRSNRPLLERMTLVFHDWFATSNDKVDSQRLMLAQNGLLRAHALGSFAKLFATITANPAMLLWLDGVLNQAGSANENYAREMMELFSLGAGRGAYTEQDIREQARALTGWTVDYSDQQGAHNFRYEASLHDGDPKTVFGHKGNYDWRDAVRLCLQHPLHASFFVTKLWSYFIPTAPSRATVAALSAVYRRSHYGIRPVLEAILLHRDFYDGPMMVKPPVVFTAGMLRALGSGVYTDDWLNAAAATGQRLFYPPNVSGWTKDRWLDTSTYKGRWEAAATALTPRVIDPNGKVPPPRHGPETARDALSQAVRDAGQPVLSAATTGVLTRFAASAFGARATAQTPPMRAMRRNALRHLILASPDYQVA